MFKVAESPVERTTAATDVLLAAIGVVGAVYLQHAEPGGTWKAGVWSWVFALVAFSAILGAVVHGFALSGGLHVTLWQGINRGLGLAVSLFVIGVVTDLVGTEAARRLLKTMLIAGVGFYLVTRIFPGIFALFVLYQATASLFAVAVYGWLAIVGELEGAGLMAIGGLANLTAGWLQTRKRWFLTIRWTFDHNGLFHLVQAGAMILILSGLVLSSTPQ